MRGRQIAVAGLDALAFVDPAHAVELGVLVDQRFGPTLELLGVHFAVAQFARHAHELLLALQEAQPQLLLGVFKIVAQRLLLTVNFFHPQVGEHDHDDCQEQEHRHQRRQHGVTVLAVG